MKNIINTLTVVIKEGRHTKVVRRFRPTELEKAQRCLQTILTQVQNDPNNHRDMLRDIRVEIV